MEKNLKKIDKNIKVEKIVRLIVFRSNKAIYVQAFDVSENKVLASSSSLKIDKKQPLVFAKEVGTLMAKKLDKIKAKYIFDRNGYLYHGQVKALAEGLRQGGINI